MGSSGTDDYDDCGVTAAPASACAFETASQIPLERSTDNRVSRLEVISDNTRERVASNAKAVETVAKQITDLDMRFSPKWATVAAALCVIVGWVWVAARYPDPDKFEKLKEHVQSLQIKQVEIQADTANVAKAITMIDARQARIEAKLDAVIGYRSSTLAAPSSHSPLIP